jgi:Glycosyl transferases group 1
VIGVAPSIPDHSWIRRLTPEHGSAYPHFATWLRTIAGDFDLAVAPLVDSRFNRLKSDLKLMEYTALGLPVLASTTGPYQGQHGAVLCDGVDEWYTSIHRMVTDPRALDERRVLLAHSEAAIWNERRASIAGETIVGFVSP